MRTIRLWVAVWCFASAASLVAQSTVDFVITNNLSEPYGVAVALDDVYYLTDNAHHRVLSYDPKNGTLASVAGVKGKTGMTDGPGFVAEFFSPRGLVLARDGLVVADAGNHTLRYLTLTGSVWIVSTLAGQPGVPGSNEGVVAAADANFNSPSGLAVDSAGNIFIADSKNNMVRKLDLDNQVSVVATNLFEPAGVAVGDGGELYVTDTRNHSIKRIEADGTVIHLAGSTTRQAGTLDSFFAEDARFNGPMALVWLGGQTGLLVADTGNHTVRRIYFDPVIQQFFPERNGYSVELYAGVAGSPGFVDGAIGTARFHAPLSLSRDREGGLLVVDAGNNALRRIQVTPPKPRVSEPQVGYVIFVLDDQGVERSQLVPISDGLFNNDILIAALAEEQTETFFTFGTTPDLFDGGSIPTPNATNSLSPPPYSDGLTPDEVSPSMVDARPDLTIKLISSAEGRRPSEVVQARFRFKAASPFVVGDNPGSFQISSITEDAEIWYTVDGSNPTNAAPSMGPIANGTILNLLGSPIADGQTELVFRARAFRANYKPSEVATKRFSVTDFLANRMSFGFQGGEASSDFVAAPGQNFMAPITLSLLQGSSIYSMQFALSVTNLNGPGVPAGGVGFESMLLRRDLTFSPPLYFPLPPAMFLGDDGNGGLVFTNLLSTNSAGNRLSVGYLERLGQNFLYDTLNQDLVSFSQAHNTRFESSGGKVIVGGFHFQVPTTAAAGDVYEIKIEHPSATRDGVAEDVFIQAPTNGSLALGAINSVKHVSIGQRQYLVGDSAPFRWFNAGDFGDSKLLNNDVMDLFQAVIYDLNAPPEGVSPEPGTPVSDFFDAMDSCCGGAAVDEEQLFLGDYSDINLVTHGDSSLTVSDLFVTFRRSLDPSLTWYARYWSNGVRQVTAVANALGGSASLPAPTVDLNALAERVAASGSPAVTFSADVVRGWPLSSVEVPVRVHVDGPFPLRVLAMSVTVEPLNGAPRITAPIRFDAGPDLGPPTLKTSKHAANLGMAWLNHTASVSGLMDEAVIGFLQITLPEQADESSLYRIRLDHASASPNGLAIFPQELRPGLLALNDVSQSAWADGIPDEWRWRHFGSLGSGSGRSASHWDADGDGFTNWQEYQAGTDPTSGDSRLRLRAVRKLFGGETDLEWWSAKGKRYQIEASGQLDQGDWQAVSGLQTGDGGVLSVPMPVAGEGWRFFRVRLLDEAGK